MIKLLLVLAIIYCVIGVLIEVNAKGKDVKFNKEALMRVVTWPKIIYNHFFKKK
jgi:hypothetical protein